MDLHADRQAIRNQGQRAKRDTDRNGNRHAEGTTALSNALLSLLLFSLMFLPLLLLPGCGSGNSEPEPVTPTAKPPLPPVFKELDPTRVLEDSTLAALEAVRPTLERRELEAASQELARIVQQQPHNVPAIRAWTWVLLREGRASEARLLCHRTLSRDRRHPAAGALRLRLAEAFLIDDEPTSALDELARIPDRDSLDAQVHLVRARALLRPRNTAPRLDRGDTRQPPRSREDIELCHPEAG